MFVLSVYTNSFVAPWEKRGLNHGREPTGHDKVLFHHVILVHAETALLVRMYVLICEGLLCRLLISKIFQMWGDENIVFRNLDVIFNDRTVFFLTNLYESRVFSRRKHEISKKKHDF